MCSKVQKYELFRIHRSLLYKMKTSVTLILASLFFASSVLQAQQTENQSSQPQSPPQGWVKQNSGTTNGLLGVSFTSPDTGWVAAGGGFILRTTDAGLHWNQFPVPDPLGVSSIAAVDGMTAWCTDEGSHGNMFFTTNGGQVWTQQVPNTSGSGISALSFPTRYTGYGIGGYGGGFFIKTTNAGTTWGLNALGSGNGFIRAVHFLDSMNGLIAGDSTLYRVYNGGPGFVKQRDTSFAKVSFYGCQLVTQNIEFAVGEIHTPLGPGIIVKSTDAGKTWSKFIYPDISTGALFNAIAFTDSLNGTAVGFQGLIIRTTDGGNSWNKQESGVITDLLSIKFTDLTNGTIVGEAGVILHTTNAGYSWVRQKLPTPLDVEISPQPFAEQTTVRYSLPSPAHVSIGLYDVTGKVVQHIIENVFQESGMHSIGIDGNNLHEGTYYLRLDAGSFTGFGKLTKIAQ